MILDSITDRSTSLHIVLASIEVNREKMVKGIRDFLEPVLQPGETMPDLDFLFELFARALRRLFDRLRETEEALGEARKIEKRVRKEHGKLVKALYRKVVDVRGLIIKLFGRLEALALTHIDGETSTVPLELLNQARAMEEKLSEPGLELPPPLVPVGDDLDPERWVAKFRNESADLTRVDKKLTQARLVTQAAVIDKDHAFAAFNGGFVKIAETLVALYRLAGHGNLARVIAPSKQNPGLTLVEARSRRKAAKTRRAKKAEAAETEDEAAKSSGKPPGSPPSEPT